MPKTPKPVKSVDEPKVGLMGAGGSNEEATENQPAEAKVAEMGAGASEQNVENVAEATTSAAGEEGFRDEAGRFTGNPPTDAERLDAICDLLEANGMSLPKVLKRPKE